MEPCSGSGSAWAESGGRRFQPLSKAQSSVYSVPTGAANSIFNNVDAGLTVWPWNG